MDNTDYIESYFTNELVPDQAGEFEKRIESDPDFAEEVAFYLSALNVSREVAQTEKKEHFKKLYRDNSAEEQSTVRRISDTRPLRKLVYYIASAAVVLGHYLREHIHLPVLFLHSNWPANMKKKICKTLPVTMSGKPDSIQTGRIYIIKESLQKPYLF